MISRKLKVVFGLSIPLFILHGIEEYRTGFYNVDKLYQFIFRPFSEMSGNQVMFITFQIMLWLLLVVSFLLVASERWRLRMIAVLGVVYILELQHIWKAVVSWSYHPGLITALAFPVIGFFFWRELIKSRNMAQN
ncbi:MAG: hypothetical protein A2W52_02485 [Candidatus Taylorbacteria bacterium RIFCSPHIGHO2_02_49_25]|uniref:HXXEE domain-containing protein n=1 Tax=Candidatus Taylorbacteria bacterium RIFCSPHIGHO2_02_49_25 TaxID=1802305 RepID=A0A1G2MFB1_9BACT|nr:MAG: hypothetical protein UY62_C0001G0007 [Parcubacteria group bacterium GW2011_GWF2_50_9]OHA19265.1 MAG: hypothetical protein A2759_03145 [Candidatus Taylorbacteria bacterium RIFCSPHIGHO2_01_FULL_49_60]OHA21849.1 MAG: hypothetical protein A2W52_02485 [Candidatus Taylorbacteria bacterium RIFCSPHIGHO2_02_49_25]OHA35575.1 MAG: hypothetical protein A2W65_00765 [Candidatus Taylorbacteria bacterium RIFCSPLOWO2_02_50_13]OHA36864.1 MAG: hypothetical protein A3B27_01020 [Candidatus Taylorbacteria ba